MSFPGARPCFTTILSQLLLAIGLLLNDCWACGNLDSSDSAMAQIFVHLPRAAKKRACEGLTLLSGDRIAPELRRLSP